MFKMLFPALTLAALCSTASASVIQTATVIKDPGYSGYSAVRLVNQSGLSQKYVGGVTSFETFAASGVTHTGSSGSNGFLAQPSVNVDFDLGSAFSLVKFGLFNDTDYQAVRNFQILVSNDSSFATFTSAGAFTATYTQTATLPIQVFNLNGAAGRYARVTFQNNHGGVNGNPSNPYVNVGEVVFGTNAVNAVPEPATISLFAFGVLCCVASRRKGTNAAR